MPTPTVAVIGATGFVGKALVARLARGRGARVRCLARNVAAVPKRRSIEAVPVDLDKRAGIGRALEGVTTAYYLVHAMSAGDGFPERDRAYARRFARAAQSAGVERVVYLGGLYPRDVDLSSHLASRREVGDILRTSTGALVVRAGIILGEGSASFEIMHDLVRKLPVMVTPRWVSNACQPIWIGDVVETLARARDVEGGREVDLVGREVFTYREMLLGLARTLDRRCLIVGVPVLTPTLSSYWLRFVTSVPLPIARALIESLRHDAVGDGSSLCDETGVRPVSFDVGVRRALAGR